MTEPPLSLYKCVTNAQACIQDHQKQRSQKIPRTAVQRPLRCLDKPMLVQGGGGGERLVVERMGLACLQRL